MAEEFFTRALAWQQEKGYTVYHETHRKRFLHSPWVARRFMPRWPLLSISTYISTLSTLSCYLHYLRYLHYLHYLLIRFPDMKMVADLSHWVCVAETDPSDPDLTAVIERFAGQMLHTHCRWGQSSSLSHDSVYCIHNVPLSRVGYDHGPQVPDPRAADWLPYMEVVDRCSR